MKTTLVKRDAYQPNEKNTCQASMTEKEKEKEKITSQPNEKAGSIPVKPAPPPQAKHRH